MSSLHAALEFKIVDETNDYLVVDKPPFLLAHPTKPDGRPTLWKQLRELLAFEIANGGQISIINRLDRETSGLMLVAKTAVTARRFGMLMQQQRVWKQYLAIVWGWPQGLARQLLLPRHALHSTRLGIMDELEWTSSLPSDLADFCP